MYIFARTKITSPSEFQFESNALIFIPIGHELSVLRQFYNIYPKMEIFPPAPSVLQTAVTTVVWLKQSLTQTASSTMKNIRLNINILYAEA
jgi:hypothetical protein